jgi:hypothetical protein
MPPPAGAAARPFDAPWIATSFSRAELGRGAAGTRIAGPASRLLLAAAGGVPVTLIAASAFGLDLRVLAMLVLAPVVAALLARMAVHAATRRLVAQAIVAGIAATALYDAWRASFLWLGLMPGDPIPHIGAALGIDPAWLGGYGWRYLGNGSGLALAFLALGLRGRRAGVAYGLGVCACLLLTLLVSPYGTRILFPLNLTTVVMATVGHAIYGAVLGTVAAAIRPDGAASRAWRPAPGRAPSAPAASVARAAPRR